MKLKEIRKLWEILHYLRFNKEADTTPSATHDAFLERWQEGIDICEKALKVKE